jgi:hypothetical protein
VEDLMTRSIITITLILFPIVQARSQCTKDTDCKGDRICVNGECVASQSVSGSNTRGNTSERLAPVLGIVTVGPVFSNWLIGGGIGAGLLAGGPGHYFSVQGDCKFGINDGDFGFTVGGDLGYQAIFTTITILRPHFFVTGGYAHMWENDEKWDEMYDYHVPYARIGGGLLFGRGKRFNNGFEIALTPGYAIHANADENPWDEDYSGFYFCADIHYVLTY